VTNLDSFPHPSPQRTTQRIASCLSA